MFRRSVILTAGSALLAATLFAAAPASAQGKKIVSPFPAFRRSTR